MQYVDMGRLSSYRVGSPYIAVEQLELFDGEAYEEEQPIPVLPGYDCNHNLFWKECRDPIAHTGFVRFKGCT